MKRLWGKGPRWAVERERISDKGNARWFTVEKFYDPVDAFELMLSERGHQRVRVFDRRAKKEMMWPGHNYRMPPKFFDQIPLTKSFNPAVWSKSIADMIDKEILLKGLGI